MNEERWPQVQKDGMWWVWERREERKAGREEGGIGNGGTVVMR